MSTQDLTTPASSKVPAPMMPFGLDVLREELLTQAGFDKAKRIATLEKVIDNAIEDLAAESDTLVTERGQIMAIHKQKNYVARAKAREQLIDLIGLPHVKGTGEASKHTTNVTIPLPNWAKVTMESKVPPPPVIAPTVVEAETIDPVITQSA